LILKLIKSCEELEFRRRELLGEVVNLKERSDLKEERGNHPHSTQNISKVI